jgi:tRNA threonylcarbamoyladenosine biosynthesis protein TsaB
MTILALEFSSPQRSVAVLRAGDPVAAAEVIESGGNATNAFAMIESALREAKLEREQIEVIAIGLGPGSYTGIRVALSVAQGWQLARGVKLAGIGSPECLAEQARAEKIFGWVNVVIDAQRNEIYMAGYETAADGRREVEPLKILPVAEIKLRSNEGGIFIGPEVTKWFPGGRIMFPRAAMLAELAARRDAIAAGETLEPIYLRETNFVKSPPRLPDSTRPQ